MPIPVASPPSAFTPIKPKSGGPDPTKVEDVILGEAIPTTPDEGAPKIQTPEAKAANEVEAEKKMSDSKVPKPQNYRRREAVAPHFDSLMEVSTQHEAHLLIPVKSYPLINWNVALAGKGNELQPVTRIERATGAAILIRNVKRTIHRKVIPELEGIARLMPEMPVEFNQLNDKLAAIASKTEAYVSRQGAALGTNAAPSLDVSNRPLPPTPKLEDDVKGKLLPHGSDLKIKVDANMGPGTPALESPITKGEKGQGDKSTQAFPFGPFESGAQGVLPVVSEHPETKKEGDAMEVDEQIKEAHGPSVPFPAAKKAPAAGTEDHIGLHFWIIGHIEEECMRAVDMLQDLIDENIKIFERWAQDNDFDPAQYDEKEDDDSSSDEDNKPDEGDKKSHQDVIMKGDEVKEAGPSGDA